MPKNTMYFTMHRRKKINYKSFTEYKMPNWMTHDMCPDSLALLKDLCKMRYADE